MRRRPAAALVLGILLATAPRAAAEDAAPESVTTSYSGYELAAIAGAEKKLGTKVDPNAEGKTIESIETVRLDPIEERDPAPTALNVVHVTTTDDVVRHEVRLRVGDKYRKVLADESARNLRRFAYMSIVVCVPMYGRHPDTVRLVMITKDVWSLIADVDFVFTRGGAEYLMFEVEENNLAGQQVGLSARSIIQPESYSLGAAYVAPRFAGRFLSFHAEANVIVNRRSGDPEGSFGDARIERPLYSTNAEWAWSTGVQWLDEIRRRYTNAEVARFEDQLPWVWRSRRIEQSAAVTRSYGWAKKNDFTLGTILVRDLYRVPNADDYDQKLVSDFMAATVPVGETRVGAFAQWRTYQNDFIRILDYETLGLQEDYRLGYDVVLRGYPIAKALGSTRNFIGVRAGAVYTFPMGDGFARGMIDTTTEMQVDRVSDAIINGEIRLVSPRTPVGRLVFDTWVTNRWRNYLNRISEVGGEDRLRGWPTRHFVGKNVLATNLELRSRPIEIFSVMMGLAAFYDVGRAFNGSFDEIRPAQSVGFGFRFVLPQIDRSVVRGDFGFPIADGSLPQGVLPMSFFFSFHQAFRTSHIPAPFGP